jgi:hypothetical protein
MALKNLILAGFFAWLLLAGRVYAQDPISLQGNIALWERPVCTGSNCKTPEPNGVFWNVGLQLEPPSPGIGRPGVTIRELTNGPWVVKLSFYWVRPTDPYAKDYVVTQTSLTHVTFGLLAECTRYDSPENVSPFPVGACSGVSGSTQYGVSLMRDTSAAGLP